MAYDFSGQVVLVSGGTRGIGRAISECFLAGGATVVALYAGNDAAASEFSQSVAALPGTLSTYKHDVRDYAAAEVLFAQLDATHARLDVLVNCAGIRRDGVVGMLALDDWQQVLQTNLTGTYILSKFAVLAMMRRRYGRIISITSPSGKIGFEGQSNYAASKAGQVAFSKSLSKEVAKRGITVNCVSPGFIDTDFISDLPAEQVKQYKAMVPMRRFGKPDEVARAVAFLASTDADYITGTCLEVTGGL